MLGVYYAKAMMYKSKDKRFLAEDIIQDGLNRHIYVANNPMVFIDLDGLEKIVVSGGQYSYKKENYKYEFIETGLKAIDNYMKASAQENIGWVIADEGWNEEDYEQFTGEVNKLIEMNNYKGVITIEYVDEIQEITNYLLSKSTSNYHKRNSRSNDKISEFILFSHGFIGGNGIVSLAYNYNDSSYNQDLDWNIENIDKDLDSAFKENALSGFYSCNTGTAKENSFAQKWSNITNSKTYAFIGKTDYTDIVDVTEYEASILGKFYSKFINDEHSVRPAKSLPVAGNGASSKWFKPN